MLLFIVNETSNYVQYQSTKAALFAMYRKKTVRDQKNRILHLKACSIFNGTMAEYIALNTEKKSIK